MSPTSGVPTGTSLSTTDQAGAPRERDAGPVPEAQVDGRRPPKAEAAGSNPAGDAIWGRRSVGHTRSFAEPPLDGYWLEAARPTGFESPASPPLRGRSSVGRAGPSPPPRLRSHADRRSMVIGSWVRIPALPHFVTWGRSSVAERYTRRRQLSFAPEASRRLTVIA